MVDPSVIKRNTPRHTFYSFLFLSFKDWGAGYGLAYFFEVAYLEGSPDSVYVIVIRLI